MAKDVPAHALVEEHSLEIERCLRVSLSAGDRVALVGYPSWGNTGDSLIWAGQSAVLERIGVRVAFACDARTYRRRLLERAVGRGGTILLPGGGSLGDLYPKQQHLRERAISDFPEATVIQLPQTIRFAGRGPLQRFRRTAAAHGRLRLLVRDQPSLDLARGELGLEAEICPDSVFALGPLHRTAPADLDLVWVARTDQESTGLPEAALGERALRVDWLPEHGIGPRPDQGLARVQRSLTRAMRRGGRTAALLAGITAATYDPVARRRLRAGMELLSRGEVVVSDRLHAHLLATMMDIPNVLLDNSYGKNRAMYEAWTGSCRLTRFARDPAHALELAAELRSGRAA